MKDQLLFQVIKNALWKMETPNLSQNGWEVYEEMRRHCLLALPGLSLGEYHLPEELLQIWKKQMIFQIANYHKYIWWQGNLPINVPYVILKGSSAAQYYPHPEYRAMGDFDIMTKREDCSAACNTLLQNGYTELPKPTETSKHRIFIKKGMPEVEVHLFFAARSDIKQAQYIDDLIISGINPSHLLPDMINGLVLLEHINYHLEYGLGLRQILDWMMFSDKCLTDEQWPTFLEIVKKGDLDTLAIVLTRMCELYLGLPERRWSAGADSQVCERLMAYVLAAGNFGNKRTEEMDRGVEVLYYARTPVKAFRLLQTRGLQNWELAKRYPILRPFAWTYQMHKYIKIFFLRGNTFKKIAAEYRKAGEKKKLFDVLKAKQASEGVVIFQDGKYIKK